MKFFSNLHPIVLFVHFVSVMGMVMFTMNPLLIGMAFLSSVVFALSSEGFAAIKKTFIYAGCFIVIVTVTNPLFTSNGVTELFFVFGRAFTLEALYYGAAAGFMLASVFIWCRAYSAVITSDKFLYLFGKPFPKLSLVLSMSLRFIPLFARKMKAVSDVQKTMGLYSKESLTDRFFSGARIFSSVLTWSLENAVDTSNSMKARGYGFPARSSFSMFRFTQRDGVMLTLIVCLAGTAYMGIINGSLDFYYYPAVLPFVKTHFTIYSILSSGVVLFLPSAMETVEKALWNFYTSKI
ncbi:MAG: energy-coupling factor transporter transmembrane protein EcfT [Clostridia bacterium]|nr:energy-coupling factor transporter transmembrane protein EcfT [Clostridia bacterium]